MSEMLLGDPNALTASSSVAWATLGSFHWLGPNAVSFRGDCNSATVWSLRKACMASHAFLAERTLEPCPYDVDLGGA
jgi:hypothetical protein